jgi:hypothetical protein
MSREHRNNTLVEPTGNVSASAPSDNNSATYEDVVHTHTCLVCDETKSLTGFPNVLHVSSHGHNNDVCSVCYARHLEIEVASKVWNQISCPQCPMILQKEDIRVLADFETWQMYERFAYRAALLQNPAYRHCFSTSCNSGQAHDGSLVFLVKPVATGIALPAMLTGTTARHVRNIKTATKHESNKKQILNERPNSSQRRVRIATQES